MIFCAGGVEVIRGALPIGIGLVDAAINLTRFIMIRQPETIFFVGTAGSYGALPPLSLAESSHAANVELSFLTQEAYTPIDNAIWIENVSRETFFPEVVVNSSNYISTDSVKAQQLQQMGISLENMEFFAVLKVAQTFSLPARALFAVTNTIHSEAHMEFRQNHRAALDLLEGALPFYKEWLK